MCIMLVMRLSFHNLPLIATPLPLCLCEVLSCYSDREPWWLLYAISIILCIYIIYWPYMWLHVSLLLFYMWFLVFRVAIFGDRIYSPLATSSYALSIVIPLWRLFMRCVATASSSIYCRLSLFLLGNQFITSGVNCGAFSLLRSVSHAGACSSGLFYQILSFYQAGLGGHTIRSYRTFCYRIHFSKVW